MQNVVIAKPYEFVPPDRRRFWPAVFRPLIRPILARVWGVTTVDIVGIESLRMALRERSSVLLAPNHCRPCDPFVVTLLGAQAGTPLYTMASWHQFMGRRSKAWLLRRLGAFSVYREGLDRTAIRTAIELLVEARRPLVVFPEGIITRSNDRLGALHEGPAFIAHSAAKQRAKNEPGARTLIIPVALRYRFVGRLDQSAAPVLDRIENRLTWTPSPGLPLIERLRRAGNAILGLKELELVGEFRHATIAERLARLIDEILGPLEAEWKVKKREGDVPGRVRALRTAILPELVEGGLSDAERDRRWDQLARLYLAQRLSLYPPGYLEGHPSTERVLETVERLEEDLTDVATVHRPLAVTVSVGEPLAVTVDGARPAALTSDIRDRIETLLDIRCTSDRESAPAEPTQEYR
jgi:1-acyl-sn-glycerol-3-phosphate acyltransferase